MARSTRFGEDQVPVILEPAIAGEPGTTAGDPSFPEEAEPRGREMRPTQATFGAGKEQMVHEAAHAQTSTVSAKAGMGAADTRGKRDAAVTMELDIHATTVAEEFGDGWNAYNRPKGNTPDHAGKGDIGLKQTRGSRDGQVTGDM